MTWTKYSSTYVALAVRILSTRMISVVPCPFNKGRSKKKQEEADKAMRVLQSLPAMLTGIWPVRNLKQHFQYALSSAELGPYLLCIAMTSATSNAASKHADSRHTTGHSTWLLMFQLQVVLSKYVVSFTPSVVDCMSWEKVYLNDTWQSTNATSLSCESSVNTSAGSVNLALLTRTLALLNGAQVGMCVCGRLCRPLVINCQWLFLHLSDPIIVRSLLTLSCVKNMY